MEQYEVKDLPVGPVAGAIAGLAGALALVLAISLVIYLHLANRSATKQEPLVDRRTGTSVQPQFREPRLQLSPAQELHTLQLEQRTRLGSYSWVNREANVVRIPIEQAMKLIAERGLPVWTAGPEGASKMPAPKILPSSVVTNQTDAPVNRDRARQQAIREIRFDQRIGAQIPMDLEFIDETGVPVRLRALLEGGPSLLVLGYFDCPMLCNAVLNGVVQAATEMRRSVRARLRVIVVSIDPSETAVLAAAKKRNWLGRVGDPKAKSSWHFLTGSAEAIQRLSDETGFRFVYDPASGEFAHASGILVLTPEGKISTYFFGVQYPAADLLDALLDAENGRVAAPVRSLWLLCSRYNLISGKHGRTVLNIVRAGGIIAVVILITGIVRMIRAERAVVAQEQNQLVRGSFKSTRVSAPSFHGKK